MSYSVVKDSATETGVVIGTYESESTAKRIRTLRANKEQDATTVYTVVEYDEIEAEAEVETEVETKQKTFYVYGSKHKTINARFTGAQYGVYDTETKAKRIASRYNKQGVDGLNFFVFDHEIGKTLAEPEAVTQERRERGLPTLEDSQTDPIDNALTERMDSIEVSRRGLQDRIDANGGLYEFPCVFDLNGNFVTAMTVQSKHGWGWRLPDGKIFWESQAKTQEKRDAANELKGYMIGLALFRAEAVIDGSASTLAAYPRKTDDMPVKIVHNGHDTERIMELVQTPEVQTTEVQTIPENILHMIRNAHTKEARSMWKRIADRKYGKKTVEGALKG